MKRLLLIGAIVFGVGISGLGCAAAPARTGWVQSYKAGYTDENGRYCGGSEIMHIVAHKGKLYAFNGYWKDKHFGEYSSQVLRLDEPDAKWVADLTTTKQELKYERGDILHMKGNILKSVTFRTDKDGKEVDANLLVAASWAFNSNRQSHQATSIFVRNDKTGEWSHTILQEGPRDIVQPDGTKAKVRRVPRDIEVYHDPVTKVDMIFMLGGGTGIFSGTYNSMTKQIEWGQKPEYPTDGSSLVSRPLGIAEANGKLYFSVGGQLYERVNGKNPSWKLAFEMKERINPELGGFRGLSRIRNPKGSGDSLIYVWIPRGRARGDINRLDGPGLEPAHETNLRQYFNECFKEDKIRSMGILGGYNRFLPLKDPKTGKTVHLVGFQQTVEAPDADLKHGHYYKGGTYCVRWSDKRYTIHCVNGKWSEGKPVLVAPRTYAQSPFPGDKGAIYFGGFDANFQDATERAWIFKADLETVLYGKE